ncbi:Na+/H+ antiporter NhaC family protein [Shewanella sp. 202IG2-18]|uniref:Na+/H+ antiporter NhaC family protein n=1 Tax=Parashewanella hymeniacidonis TaxID=2807618 RepID=UPI00196047FF|nr:Na+/H+ antiporter NhaC family protein [Parashewanella hymeniacidonis]
MTSKQPFSAIALLPLLIFIGIFVGTGLYFENQNVDYAFYQLPSVVAILPAIIIGVLLSKKKLNQTIDIFIKGVGHNNIITMCMIYLLAGAFAAVAKATGGVDATVALGLSYIPAEFLLPGFFLISAFIATAMGTSMGTIAAVAPVAFGVVEQTNIEATLMVGAVISGALFGDNLSIISDTTIAATRTQGCEMKDKFKENLIFALPAALITLILFSLQSQGQVDLQPKDYDVFKVIPYLTILILAISGLNVFVVLTVGILFAGITGFTTSDYTVLQFSKDIYAGFGNMQEIFFLSMLVGGLAALIQQQGGIAFINHKIESFVKRLSSKKTDKSPKLVELCIALMVALTNSCIANNTVAIVVTGDIAKGLAEKHDICPKRSASLLDIFACIVQGILPFGAQALLIGSIFSISPLSAGLHAWYCMVLAVVSVIIIAIRK